MTQAFCPEDFWNYNYCNEIDVDPKALSGIKLKGGKLYEELQNLYTTYLKSAVHPCLIKIIKEVDEEESEENKNTNAMNVNKEEEEEDENDKKKY